ncbi:hypothetical protein KUCAC02_009514, partial [Chaenocephalus aceratus]
HHGSYLPAAAATIPVVLLASHLSLSLSLSLLSLLSLSIRRKSASRDSSEPDERADTREE